MKKPPIQIYFIPWAVYDSIGAAYFEAQNRRRLTRTTLMYWAHYIIAGDKRLVKKTRTDEFAIDQALTKNQLTLLIRGFDGLVIVK